MSEELEPTTSEEGTALLFELKVDIYVVNNGILAHMTDLIK